MIRLKKMLESTSMVIHRRGSRCLARIKSAEIYVDENGSYKFLQGNVVDPPAPGPWPSSRGPYTVLAKLYMDEDKSKISNPKTFVWCDCEYFKFNCETALALRGSSAIINSNGALPKITNPNGVPGLCKHCIAFLRRCRERKMFLTPKNPVSVKDEKTAIELAKAVPPPVQKSNIREKFPGVIRTNEIKTQHAINQAVKTRKSGQPQKPSAGIKLHSHR